MGFFTEQDRYGSYRRLTDRELLERIRTGDQLAEDYLWVTCRPVVLVHAKIILRDKPEQLGEPDDYATNAVLTLLDKARQLGAAVLKDDNRTIGGWLKQTATYALQNATRKDRFDRDDWQANSDSDDQPSSLTDTLEDEGVDVLTRMSEDERDQLIRSVLNTLPEKLRTLIQLKFMDGFSWEETAELMLRLYPDNEPPFGIKYLQKTYWDRTHKTPFRLKLIDTLKRYGYDR